MKQYYFISLLLSLLLQDPHSETEKHMHLLLSWTLAKQKETLRAESQGEDRGSPFNLPVR